MGGKIKSIKEREQVAKDAIQWAERYKVPFSEFAKIRGIKGSTLGRYVKSYREGLYDVKNKSKSRLIPKDTTQEKPTCSGELQAILFCLHDIKNLLKILVKEKQNGYAETT